MKTYEIKMSRSRWTCLLIAVLLIAMVGMLCSPYFTYGSATQNFVPVTDGNAAHLQSKWVLSGVDAAEDGYKEIEITSAKEMTVRTTNIIRVNQLAADAAVEGAKDAYDTVAKAVSGAEVALLKINAQEALVKEMADFIAAYEPSAAPAEGETVLPAEEIQAIKDAAVKSVDTAAKQLAKAQKEYENAKGYPQTIQDAVTAAREGAVETYSADASYAWVTETEEAFNAAIVEAYPDIAELDEDGVEAYFAEISDEEKEGKVYGKLAAEKAKAAAGYDKAEKTVEIVEDTVKAAEKAKKNAESALKSYDKEVDKLKENAAKLDASKTFADADTNVTATAIPELVYEEYEKTSSEPEMMETVGKVSYKEKKAELSLTFANGEKIDTTYSTNVSFNEFKELSILGYIGFPYEVEDFTEEMAYKIKNFYINDVILVPILLLVLAILGVVVCYLKRDKLSAAILPLAFGLVGVIGYLTSDFLKLGDKFTTHVVGYAIIVVISIVHIVLSIKEKKAK